MNTLATTASKPSERRSDASTRHDVVVIGAGAAGLSAALALKDEGIQAVVLERSDRVGASWRARYDRLRLNSASRFSHLPGRPFAKGTPTFPSRDQLIAHLEHHSHGLQLRFGASVSRIDREPDGWIARTSDGDVRARSMIVATGYDHTPAIPAWPGRDRYRGRVLHSAEYRNADPFRDERVLVVGPGSSGMEIAHDLADGGAAKVWLSARTPPNIFMREGPGGVPGDLIAHVMLHLPTPFADAFARLGRKLAVGDLTEYGLPVPDEGVFARLERLGVAPAIVDAEVIDAVKQGRIEVVRGVESLDATAAQLAGGARIEVDALIAATGYRRGLEPLVGHLGVLGDDGLPCALGERPAADGLRFIGYVPRPGMLGYSAKEAARAARAIARELRS
jgi:cation diffusion facilitator CzcD-associated flavoprotein CzcO